MVSLATYMKGQEIPAKRLTYTAGSKIFSEAEQANGMYFIEAGEVRITKNTPQTNESVNLATLGPEDFFGILSFSSGRTRLADATAVTDCTLWEIDKNAFCEAVDRCPEFSLLLINGLVKRLENLNEKMREMSGHLKEFTSRMEDLSSLWHSLAPMGGLG
ncbi:MAG: Crp/Fnr family transcriptional regulator [Candidatus Brocadiales bacterium]